ncbi:MAG: SO_0444 family Cu/Zn efflux transporter [Deferrisomatales bacterium]|nr:SO_0444 family Cu/Zn efflux transporter [Deferrisomatales bacterium]
MPWPEFASAVLAGTWHILSDAAPYLLFGLFAAGVIHAFVSAEGVARHLGRGKVRSVVKAALFGIPLPLCSCGVLPAALSLRKKGATKGATVSFLVSTPETGVDSISLTYALMDPVMTVARPVAAFATAVAAGTAENVFGREEPSPEPPPSACGCREAHGSEAAGRLARAREGLRYAFRDLLGDLAPWLALGFLGAGLITVLVPPEFIEAHLGGGLLPLLAMLVIGIPMYTCATAATPIAAALVLKGLSPGAALVYLLAGPATSLASLTVVAGTLGIKTTLRYLAALSAGALAAGAALDWAYGALGLSAQALVGASTEVFPAGVGTGSAVALIALAVGPRLARLLSRERGACACSGAT